MQNNSEQPNKKQKKSSKSDLLTFQKPLFQIKRNEEGKVQSIIAKLMQNKQKPQIGIIPRSPIFDQLKQFIPLIKQSNTELLSSEVKPEQQFDAKLQQVQVSSESSSQQGHEKMEDEDLAQFKMVQQKQEVQYLQSCDSYEINILKYPYLANQQQTKETKQNPVQKKDLKIVELHSTEGTNQYPNYLQTLQ